jgi:ribosomal protein S27E
MFMYLIAKECRECEFVYDEATQRYICPRCGESQS